MTVKIMINIKIRKNIDRAFLFLTWFAVIAFFANGFLSKYFQSPFHEEMNSSKGGIFDTSIQALLILVGAVCVLLKERLPINVRRILMGFFLALFFWGGIFISLAFGTAFGIYFNAIAWSNLPIKSPNKSSHSAN